MNMSKKYVLLMLACCMLPVAALVLVAFFKVPITTVLFGVMLLACPLSHILMMKFMSKDHHEHQDTAILPAKETSHAQFDRQ